MISLLNFFSLFWTDSTFAAFQASWTMAWAKYDMACSRFSISLLGAKGPEDSRFRAGSTAWKSFSFQSSPKREDNTIRASSWTVISFHLLLVFVGPGLRPTYS